MDLGIKGKRAVVCASSKGLGLGCALSLAEAGVDLIINSRNPQNLESATSLLKSKYQVHVEAVVADITTKEGQESVIKKAKNNLDILVTNAGGPPPGLWSDWSRSDFMLALDANMLTPISLMKEFLPVMMEKGWGRIVNITSQSVKALTDCEVMLTILPQPFSIITGKNSFIKEIGVSIFASKASIKSDRLQSLHKPGGGPPAFVTRISKLFLAFLITDS